MPTSALAQDTAGDGEKQPYAVLNEDNTTLTFYYDEQKEARGGMGVGPFSGTRKYPSEFPDWHEYAESIKKVCFDESFTNFTALSSTAFWFYECRNLTEIIGISNLKTENVTDLGAMFSGCSSLTSLDLSGLNTYNVENMVGLFYDCNSLKSINLGEFRTDNVVYMKMMFYNCQSLTTIDVSSFNTENVTDMNNMFGSCSALTTIYAGNRWSTEKIDYAYGFDMFYLSKSLIGGAGTKYDASNCGYEYAHIDGGELNPGYFTAKETSGDAEPYAVLSEDNTILTFYYDDQKAARNGLSISGELGWNDYRSSITSVVFDDSFANCETLTSTEYWFMECRNLSSISGIQNLKTSHVTNMSGMFDACVSLTSLDVSGFETDNVTNMSSMFTAVNCSSLDLSNFKTGNVVNMREMFRECSNLQTLILGPDFKTDNVTDMWLMFKDCEKLENVDLSGFNTSRVTDMTFMFHGCKSLTSLDLSQFSTENVSTMERMFTDCSSLVTIYVGEKWSIANVTNSDYMFGDCEALVGGAGTKYDASHTDASYAHIDGGSDNPGYFTAAGSEPYLEPAVTEAYAVLKYESENDAYLTMYYDDKKTSHAEEGVVVGINELAESPDLIQARRTLHSVIFDQSFAACDTIKSTKGWFANCMELKTISGLEYLNTSEVTDMDIMFMECSSLESLDLSHFNTSKVTTMSNMFFMNSSLQTLDLSSFDTSNVTDMSYMFANCYSLTTIYVSDKWSVASVTNGDYMFGECTALVGGNGTTYDENHTDPSYANIDIAGKPGYFTDIADKGKEKKEQVATPTWELQDNLLALSTKTADASIYYAMETWDDESQADSIANALEVNTSSTLYTKPIQITDNVVIKMMAAKEGMENSKDTTFIYAYKLWYELYEVIRYGVDIADKATDNPKVEQSLVEELRWALNEGDHMYQMRAEVSSREAEYFIQAIMEACKKIEEQMTPDEQVATPTFSFGGDSLVIICATEDALIWYQSAEIDSTFVDEWAQYTAPMFVGDIKINAKATKEGMLDSEIASMVYYYTEWQKLIETTYICDKVLSEILQSKPSENITKMIDDVYVELAYVRAQYEGHRLEWDRDKIEDEIMKLKHVVAEIEEEWKKESSEATYENLTLTVGGTNTMATALEMVGGRDEVTKDIAAIVWNSTEPLTKSDLEGFDNPNMLIFVNEASMAPEGVENVVVDGKAKSIVLIDTDSINNNFYAPQEFTAESISYTREFKQTTQKDVSRGWEGICLPFTVQAYTHDDHGTIAPFRNDASEFHFWLHQMTEDGMAIATDIEANKPYIISMPNNITYPATYNQAGKVTFSAKDVVVPVSTPVMIHLSDGSIGVGGVYNSLPKMEGFYALNVGDDFDGYPEGSVFVNNYRTIRPFEVYSYHASRSAGTRTISVSSLFGGVDGATGILDVMDKQESDEIKVYSINGILLKNGNRSEVMNSLPKGLYIIGNQKIMVK